MIFNKINILFTISVSVFITYIFLLGLNYSEIPEIVDTHINIRGETDATGIKNQLWIASTVNFIVLLIIGFILRKPHLANYPVEITEENKEAAYRNMKIFLSIVAIITSCSFAYMIFKAINYTENYFYLIGYLVVLPTITIMFFKKNAYN